MSQRRKTIPLGAALDTPDEKLDMAALITPEDIEAARADAERRMTRRGRALLNAARVEGDNTDEPTGQTAP